VRIGAILSLERIAQDSTTHDRGRDHVRVMEILCAYVRENSNAREPKDSWRQIWERESKGGADGPGLTKEEFMEKHKLDPESLERMTSIEGLKAWAGTLKAPRVDVLLALQVLGRRTNEQRKAEAAWPDPPDKTTAWPFDIPCPDLPEEPDGAPTTARAVSVFREELKGWKDQISGYKGYRLDLSGANLQGADLSARRPDGSDAVFGGANLSGVRLEGATLRRIRMEGADLRRGRLDGAFLWSARLDGASLFAARMEGADLSRAELRGSVMFLARMEGSSLLDAQMLETTLSGAGIENVDARGVKMQGAYLRLARINGANLEGAKMDWSYLNAAVMDNATAFPDVTFHGAAFQAIDMTDTHITQGQVNSAFADGSVTLPVGLNRPAHWPVGVLPVLGEHSFSKELKKWRGGPANYSPPPPSP
jgi:prepilin-type processing-associated H-X9-DG protein